MDHETENSNPDAQSNELTKFEKRKIEIEETLKLVEDGTLEVFASTGSSQAWKKFMKIRNTESKKRVDYVQCNDCKILLTYKEHGGTSHLIRHKCHISSEEAIENSKFCKLPLERTDQIKTLLNTNAIQFCAKEMTSFESVSDSQNFIEFAQSFVSIGKSCGNIELDKIYPNSTVLGRRVAILKDEKQRDTYLKFREALKSDWCSSTLGIQVFNGAAEKSFLVMRIQFIEKDLSALRNEIIFSTPFDQRDTPEKFLINLNKQFRVFGGDESDLQRLKIVSSNLSIFTKALQDRYSRKECVADVLIDILDLAFKESQTEEIDELFSNCKDIVQLLSEKYNLNLIPDNGTWNSKLRMLQSINDQYNDVETILNKENKINIQYNKRKAEELVTFLEPFVDALEDLSATSHTTSNKILLWWTLINNHFESSENYCYELKQIATNAKNLFRSKFRIQMDYKIDCFLDPKYKMLKMLNETERAEVIQEIRNLLKDVNGTTAIPGPSTLGACGAPEPKKSRFAIFETQKGDNATIRKKPKDKEVEDRFSKYETKTVDLETNDEVNIYLGLPKFNIPETYSKFDAICKFWKSKEKTLPNLFQLAMSRLNTPACCGCIGRNKITLKQDLKDDFLNDLLLIRDNI